MRQSQLIFWVMGSLSIYVLVALRGCTLNPDFKKRLQDDRGEYHVGNAMYTEVLVQPIVLPNCYLDPTFVGPTYMICCFAH